MVEICFVCGDRGYSNALLECSKCSEMVVHQYCIGIPPGSIDDSFNWVCEYCGVPEESPSNYSLNCGDADTILDQNTSEEVEEGFTLVFQEEVVLKSLFHKNFTRKRRSKKRRRKRKRIAAILASDEVVAVGSDCKRMKSLTGDRSVPTKDVISDENSNSNVSVEAETPSRQGAFDAEVTENMDVLQETEQMDRANISEGNHNAETLLGHQIDSVQNCSEDSGPTHGEIIPVEDQPEPLAVCLPLEYHATSSNVFGNAKVTSCSMTTFGDDTSDVMECPDEIMRGLVLLVSPSGETFIYADPCLFGDVLSPSLATSILKIISSFTEVSSERFIEQVGPYKALPQLATYLDLAVDNWGIAENCNIEQIDELSELRLGTGEEIASCYLDEPTDKSKIADPIHTNIFVDGKVDGCNKCTAFKLQLVDNQGLPGNAHDQLAPLQVQPEAVKNKISEDCRQTCGSSQDSTDPCDSKEMFKTTICDTLDESAYACSSVIPQQSKVDVQNAATCEKADNKVLSEMTMPGSVLLMAGGYDETSSEKVFTKVGRYNVRSDLAPTLRDILDKYEDSFSDCIMEPELLIESICKVIQNLQKVPFRGLQPVHLDCLRSVVKQAEDLTVEIKWLQDHLEYLEGIFQQLSQYPKMKRELKQNIKYLRSLDMWSLGDKVEAVEQERKLSKKVIADLECSMESIKTRWRNLADMSLADGLF